MLTETATDHEVDLESIYLLYMLCLMLRMF